jgi:hypothetical protein
MLYPLSCAEPYIYLSCTLLSYTASPYELAHPN